MPSRDLQLALLAPSPIGFILEESFVWERLEDNSGLVEGTWTRWSGIHLRKPKEYRAGKEGVRVETLDKFRLDNKLGEEKGLPVPVFCWDVSLFSHSFRAGIMSISMMGAMGFPEALIK